MTDRRDRAVTTAMAYSQGNIAGLDDANTRRLIASTVMTESDGGDLAITNCQGYVGRYQAGAGWLAEAGYIDKEKLRNAMANAGYRNEWSWASAGHMTTFLNDLSNWTNGLSLEKYKASAQLQDEAFRINSSNAYNQAIRNGVLHAGDSQEKIAGFLKARHIAGYGGAVAAVTGGREVSDANGTSNYRYMEDITLNRDGLNELMNSSRNWVAGIGVSSEPYSGLLRLGMKGEQVRELQSQLQALGYTDQQNLPLRVDGYFGARTEEVLRTFQHHRGLEVDGLAGPNTRTALREAIQSQSIATFPQLTPDIDTATISILQQHLNAVGITDHNGKALSVTGIYDAPTRTGVTSFQLQQGLSGTGVADPATLALIEARAHIVEVQQASRAHSGLTQGAWLRESPGFFSPTLSPPAMQHMPPATTSPAIAQTSNVADSHNASMLEQQRLHQQLIQQQIIQDHQRLQEQTTQQREQEQKTTQERQDPAAYSHEPAPIPDHLRDFRHPDHPMHSRYQHALGEVHYMEDQHKIEHGEHSERLAAALVDRLHEERFGHLEKLQLRGQGKDMQVVAYQSRPSVYMPEREVSLSINQATARPVEAVAHDWSKRAMPHLHEPLPVMASEPLPHPRNLPAHDLRHPDHPQHALYQHVHTQVADAFAKAGVPRSEAQLEHATAATLLQAQINQIDWSKPAQIALAQDPVTGAIGPDSKLSIRTHDHVFGELQELVPASAMQQAPEVSFQQMGQVAQQQAQEWAAFEQQRAQANMQQHLYPTMPGGGPGGGP